MAAGRGAEVSSITLLEDGTAVDLSTRPVPIVYQREIVAKPSKPVVIKDPRIGVVILDDPNMGWGIWWKDAPVARGTEMTARPVAGTSTRRLLRISDVSKAVVAECPIWTGPGSEDGVVLIIKLFKSYHCTAPEDPLDDTFTTILSTRITMPGAIP